MKGSDVEAALYFNRLKRRSGGLFKHITFILKDEIKDEKVEKEA
ncbi:MAG: hypothetical protein VW333_05800 [Pseudomonadales bacterium]|jgi:hypothetical protein